MTKRKKVNYNTEQINKEYSKCVSKVGKSVWQKYKYVRPKNKSRLKNLSLKKRWQAIEDSRKEFIKKHKKEMKEYDKKWKRTYKKCNKQRRDRLKTLLKHKPKEKCCKCHYVKNKRGLRKVRGPYGHCSYDMQNCCKDKKNIK